MFNKSAKFYDALYHFKDYAAASEKLHQIIHQHNPHARTLLDVACGTGKHLEILRHHYDVEGLDRNPELLETAKNRCPGVAFHQASMADFRLGRTFDVITCLFSSIAYVKTLENMRQTIANMAKHLKPGGILALEPFFGPENYWVDRLTANYVDQPDLKIAWMYISKRNGRLGILDIHYLIGRHDGFEYFQERHELGLFTKEEYFQAFYDVQLEVKFDSEGLFGRGMYLGRNVIHPKSDGLSNP